MIILFNLNKYVGGGEILTIRIAEYFKTNNIKYILLTYGTNCYIANQAIKSDLDFVYWPETEDSIAYMASSKRDLLVNKIRKLFEKEDLIYLYTFCMRDLYNSLFIFSRFHKSKVYFSTGIYHPEDVYYLSSLSFKQSSIIEFNRNLLYNLTLKNAVLYINENALLTSLGSETTFKPKFIPIPIPMPEHIPNRVLDPKRPIKIVCISRFVGFKIASVLAIIRFVRKNRGYELSLIGYGIYRFILTLYISIHGMKNVRIVAGVGPDQLDDLIDQADIGYAQGTSILEIAKRGIPVVIAPYSNILDIFNPNFLCMGVFGERDDFNFGDYRSHGGPESVRIDETIKQIVGDYSKYIALSVTHTKRFSAELICKEIQQFIVKSNFSNDLKLFNPPKAPFLKKILRKFVKF